MSACDDVRAELSACLDGEVPAAVRSACDEHLRVCEACRAALAELQSVSAGVADLPRLKAPATLAVSVRHAVARQPSSQEFLALARLAAQAPPSTAAPKSVWGLVGFAVAALFMLCVLAFVVLPILSANPHYRAVSSRESAEKTKRVARAAPAGRPAPARAPRPEPAADESAAAAPTEVAPAAAERANVDEVARELRKATAEPAPGADARDTEHAAQSMPALPPAVRPPAPPPVAAAPAPPVPSPRLQPGETEPPMPVAAKAPDKAESARRALATGGEKSRGGRTVGAKAGPALTEERSKPAGVADKVRDADNADDRSLALKQQKDAGLAVQTERAAKAAELGDVQEQVGREGKPAEAEANQKREVATAAKGPAEAPKAKLAAQKPEADGVAVRAPDGAAGNALAFDKKTEGVALEPAKESGARERKSGFADKAGGEAVAAAKTSPARPQDPAAPPRMGKGFGAGALKAAPVEVIVYKTRDPARLIAQLRGLAAENAAGWEAGDNFGPTTGQTGGLRAEKKIAQSNAAPAAPPNSMVFEIVTTSRQRAAIVAKLRDLQSSQMPLDQRQAGAQAQDALKADAPRTGGAAQVLQPEARHAAETQAQQRAPEDRDVRIQIRIEPWPAAE